MFHIRSDGAQTRVMELTHSQDERYRSAGRRRSDPGSLLQRPVRTIIYGFAIWWLWFAFVGISQLMPESVRSSPSFALLRLLVLVVLVVAFTVDYLRRVGRSTVGEGLVVGFTWTALVIANDIGHFLFMPGKVDFGVYLTTAAPLYAFIPVITTLVFGRLVSSRSTNPQA
jgi:hypothetical protein